MSNSKITKQFFSISSDDATNRNNINSMQFNFNNTALTDIQNSGGGSCVFTPVNLTLDWDYTNISEVLKNNKMVFTVGAVVTIVTVPDGSYNATNLTSLLNHNLNTGAGAILNAGANMGWNAYYDPLSNRLSITYTLTGPVDTEINTNPEIATVRYDMTRLLGTVKSTPRIIQTILATAPKYNPNGVDFKVFDVLRIHSNIAKRFYELKGTDRKVLSNNSVLFELVVPNISLGSSLVFENLNSDIYSQEVLSNFDNLTIDIKDKNGNLIPFKSYCSFNMTFIMTRTIEQQSTADRLKNLSNFNLLGSV